jgi:UDP-2-acetamido-2,6-beta-L-arabino-hexul-4-ose reductase
MIRTIVVTGALGFIGKNLCVALKRIPDLRLVSIDVGSPDSEVERGLAASDLVFHLAGVNRPESDEEYESVNVGALVEILKRLEHRSSRPLIVLSSSTQALLDNPYGRSKRRAEQALFDFAARTGTPARIFRLPGVFGKWCRPNYNSVVATFCHNLARGLPIQMEDPLKKIDIVHVDDVLDAWLRLIDEEVQGAEFGDVRPAFGITLGELAATLSAFKADRESLHLPDLSDPLSRRLYGTYVSYLPSKAFAYSVMAKSDARGALAELLKADGHGQIFVSRTRPGVTRGNHFHDLKVEKFIVVEGEAMIRFRHIATDERAEYRVAGTELRMIDIPPGWTHSIENVGSADMITLFWSSEVFDPARPDTYPAEVLK